MLQLHPTNNRRAPESAVDLSPRDGMRGRHKVFTMQRKASKYSAKATMILFGAIVLFGLSGCAGFMGLDPSNSQWLSDGSLALSRPVPPVSRPSAKSSIKNIAAITPSAPVSPSSGEESIALIVSRSDRTLTAIRPGAKPLVVKTEGAQLLPRGSFSVTMKEENPLWYAPKEYFVNRAMPVPSEGSRERFKRAALGERTIYLNDQTPIHSGPVWLKEIGGLRVPHAQMDQIFSMVTVGTRVEVR